MRSTVVGVSLIFFAFLIDATQWATGWVFFILGTASPTATGIIIGNQYCPTSLGSAINSGCQGLAGGLGLLFNLIPGVAQAGSAVGIAIGTAVSVVVGFMFGSVLVFFMAITKNLNWRYIGPAFIGKTVPFLNFLPGWTGATVMCVFSSKAKGVLSGTGFSVASKVAGTLAPEAAPVLAAARTLQRNAPPRTPQEGSERAGEIRSQVLRDVSQGIRSVRPAITPQQEPAPLAVAPGGQDPLQKRYGFAA